MKEVIILNKLHEIAAKQIERYVKQKGIDKSSLKDYDFLIITNLIIPERSREIYAWVKFINEDISEEKRVLVGLETKREIDEYVMRKGSLSTGEFLRIASKHRFSDMEEVTLVFKFFPDENGKLKITVQGSYVACEDIDNLTTPLKQFFFEYFSENENLLKADVIEAFNSVKPQTKSQELKNSDVLNAVRRNYRLN